MTKFSVSVFIAVLSAVLLLPAADAGGQGLPTLMDNLVAHWKLDESGGTRYDSHGNNDLTDVNTVQNFPGKIDISALFNSGSVYENLQINSSNFEANGNSFAVTFWVYPYVLGDPSKKNGFLAKGEQADSSIEYMSLLGPYGAADQDQVRLYAYGPGSILLGYVTNSSHGPLTQDTWQFIYLQYDASTNKIGVSTNNGTLDEVTLTGSFRTPINDLFTIGRAAASDWHFYGAMDSFSFWSRILTPEEITAMYNNGDGLDYPFYTPPPPPTPEIWTGETATFIVYGGAALSVIFIISLLLRGLISLTRRSLSGIGRL